MSLSKFPAVRGLSFGTRVTPRFNTNVVTSTNGHETRNSLQEYPLWDFEVSFEFLANRRDGTEDLERIVGFFLDRKGSFETFLFEAPETPYEQMTLIGTGDGTNTDFPLVRTMGSFSEPAGGILNIEDAQVYLNGDLIASSEIELVDNHIIRFVSAPGEGDLIEGCYKPLFRVRFKEDSADFTQFMSRLWELQQLELRSVFI